LGMQMQCNRMGVAALPHIPSFRGDEERRTRNLAKPIEIPRCALHI
jgi:hypothetical protein